jgi:hypothetical protein
VNGTGTNYRRLVRLNVSTGAIVPGLQPRPNRVVTDLVVRGGWLYASGEFDVTTPVNRVGLARFNVNTGAMDPNLDIPFTDPNNVPERDPAKDGVMQVWKIDVTPDGSRLIAIGNFNTVGGSTASRDPRRRGRHAERHLVADGRLPSASRTLTPPTATPPS